MKNAHKRVAGSGYRRSGGFTLIELLTVIAIIGLLIGLLVPGLSKAREQAKKTSTAATIKALGDGLEMFQGENEQEFGGYPPSAIAEDQTEAGTQAIYGAQWLVRYLMGKDLNGYVPRRSVPLSMVGEDPFEQEGWYNMDAHNGQPLDRVGPYIAPEGVTLGRPEKLPGALPPISPADESTLRQLVVLDDFGFPILYYRADPRQAARANADLARYEQESTYGGVFTFDDNALFTGKCQGTSGTCEYPPWDFTGNGVENSHRIQHFGEDPPDRLHIGDHLHTFQYYILDRNAYDATLSEGSSEPDIRRTVTPYQRSRFILISAGKDGLYGTGDDVNNF